MDFEQEVQRWHHVMMTELLDGMDDWVHYSRRPAAVAELTRRAAATAADLVCEHVPELSIFVALVPEGHDCGVKRLEGTEILRVGTTPPPWLASTSEA